jgi:tRNA modification GTPase
MEMIAARTEEGLRQAVYQLKGNLSTEIRALRCPILDLLARIEASIDFPDEDTDFSQDGLAQGIQAVAGRIEALLSTAREGMLFREGLQAVIAGKANVGKSSLLNCLLGQERAIVTPIPGTTRDFIAECINIQGIPVNVTDTAGIRDTDDPIEKKGMALVWERLAKADVVILVLDGSEVPGEEDFRIIEKIRGKAVITVFNKKDLPKKVTRADEDGIRALLPETPFLSVSAKYGEGIESLKASLYRLAVGEKSGRDTQTVITSLRHKGALERALDLLLQAGKNIREGNPPELAAYDLREASGALGEIMGETTAEDVLERIFSTFCIGK